MGKLRNSVPLTDWTKVKEDVENQVITIIDLEAITFKSTKQENEMVDAYVATLSYVDGDDVTDDDFRLLCAGQVVFKTFSQYLAATENRQDRYPLDVVLYRVYVNKKDFYWMVGDPDDENVKQILGDTTPI